MRNYAREERQIVIDHGAQFLCDQWLNELKYEGIKSVFSSVSHPQYNIVDRIHRELSRFFRTLIKNRHNSWWSWITTIESCMNATHYETAEFRPVEI